MKNVSDKVIYPELSYEIIGVMYDVFNQVGAGHKENYYQNAVASALKEKGLNFQEQVYTPLIFNNKRIGHYYFDFLVDGKIVLELKKDIFFRKPNIDQVFSYLKSSGLKLGIIVNFMRDGIKFKRIVNVI